MKLTAAFNRMFVALLLLSCSVASAVAQEGSRAPEVVSPQVTEEGKVAFRLLAPEASSIRLVSPDVGGLDESGALAKNGEGVWELVLGPIDPPRVIRYQFNVDGIRVADPANRETSEANATVFSTVFVPGLKWMELRDVPHGAVSEVTYRSKSPNRFRRMHVYTPPGYESGEHTYPVFYLLHGASDSDDSWTTVGRANVILDNLIADGEAVPMVVVMPDGHVGRMNRGQRGFGMDEFVKEFREDIVPHIQKTYRVHTDRANSAIAGLSMGGAQTLNIIGNDLADYGYIGVYSSGIFGINRDQGDDPTWEEKHLETLEAPDMEAGLEHFWFATGRDDFLVEVSRDTVTLFEKHDFKVTYKETAGGHTWINWREYLNEFVPMLFKPKEAKPTEVEVEAEAAATSQPLSLPTSVVIEDGGAGGYPAIATEDPSLPGLTIFRPREIASFGAEQKLPVLLWGNGACANTTQEHKNFLNEIASHGYLILAIGLLDQIESRDETSRQPTQSSQLLVALDWAFAENKSDSSAYSGKLDTGKVAAMGMSCGGLQAIEISGDPRISTSIICNSGVLPTPSPRRGMPPLDKAILKKFQGPVLYIMGGPTDIAYENAMDDFTRVDHVPIVMTNLDVGHGGTYARPHGGEFTSVALAWLDWQLKGKEERSEMFLGENSVLERDPKWTVEAKNFGE